MSFFTKLKDRLFKSSSQLDEGLDAPQQRANVLSARGRGDRIGASQLDVGRSPTERSAEIDDATSGEQRAQRPLRFLLDLFPAGFGNGRAITKEMVLHFLT